MNLMKMFFKSQMGMDVCPPAKQKLFARILPKLCIESNICPVCSGDLEISITDLYEGSHKGTYKICTACKAEYKGDSLYVPRRGPDSKPKTNIQREGSIKES